MLIACIGDPANAGSNAGEDFFKIHGWINEMGIVIISPHENEYHSLEGVANPIIAYLS
jgi:hypothetical protein